ncbi:MAG: bifunctional metallophosphatase/5'-nucleotidase [Epulopiscium sp.]|nr:bifunctional metallophosphatase/5'-nucleotidase [Candidatus Epulonipiscium sp.]
MKKTLSLLLLAFTLLTCVSAPTVSADTISDKELTITFTHDLHSYIDTREFKEDGKLVQSGGFAKIATIINETREKDPDTLVLDGGDFAMGTLFQTVFDTQAVELRMLGLLGYDAVTLGNHEFDYSSIGLANMFDAALNSGDPVPAMTISNIDWENSTDEDAKTLKNSMESYGVKDYMIVDKGGVKVAIFGLLGDDAIECAPNSGLEFHNYVDSAKEIVKIIKSEEDPDIIVCLSHSGTSETPKYSEDEILAKEVPEIDIIISGHTHSTHEEAINIGSTNIFSSGEYGKNLGVINLKQNSKGRWDVENYDLVPVNEDVKADEEVLEKIEEYRDYVNEFLKEYGFTDYEEIIAYSPFDFTDLREMNENHIDQAIGHLIADSIIHGIKEAEGDDYIPVDVSIVPVGTIRAAFKEGPISIADAYEVMSLGIGADGTIGYPIGSVYLTGKELKTVAEVDASITSIMPASQLYNTGLHYNFNPNRIILNRSTDVILVNEEGEEVEIENDKLYRVVSDLYSAQMLGAVMDKSKGILAIIPKDADGNPIEDFNECIVYNKDGSEAKEWYALASYLQSFDEVDGLPTIPDQYAMSQDRKVREDSKNIIRLVRSPNKISLIIVGVILLIIALLVLAIYLIVSKVKKRKRANLSH